MIAAWARFLCFRSRREELGAFSWRRWLGPALIATWLAGMGRYWDHPSAHILQMWGIGSVVYVFVLGALLWAVIVFVLRRFAELTWPRALVGSLLPLTGIVAALTALNLEKAVFSIMGGFREPTPNDGAYAILVMLTLFAYLAVIPLLVTYLFLVREARRESRAALRIGDEE